MLRTMAVMASDNFWAQFVDLITTPNLQLFLLLGSLMLAIALMLLTLTRLGHARPITKCVVLSVIAHVLLLGYAYGTRLIFEVPSAKTDSVESPSSIQIVELEDDSDYDTENELETKSETVNIERSELVQPSLADFKIPKLERPVEVVPFELERTVEFPLDVDPQLNLSAIKNDVPLLNSADPKLDFDGSIDTEPELANIDAEPSNFARYGDSGEEIAEWAADPSDLAENLSPPLELNQYEIEPQISNSDSLSKSEERAEQFITDLKLDDPDSSQLIVDKFAESQHSLLETTNSQFDVSGLEKNRSVFRLGDGQPTPPIYRNRSESNRLAAVFENGGNEKTEIAVNNALAWLVGKQKPDGRWDASESGAGCENKIFGHDRGGCGANADTGVTALATLALLGVGNNHLQGDFRQNVQLALEYLISQQKSDGDFSGNAKLFAKMYCHSMALLAVCEAYGVTGDIRLKKPLLDGLNFTLRAQDPDGGGWRYQPGDSGDMSQFGWKVMAIHSAESAGIEIRAEVKSRMTKFLLSCVKGNDGGLASYRPGEGPSTTMTAESLVCRSFLNLPLESVAQREANQRLLKHAPELNRKNYYYWYYATLGLFRTADRTTFAAWNRELQGVLLSQQEDQGENAGSWPPNGIWSGYGGRVYATALATLSLEVYYRYSREHSVESKSVALEPSVLDPVR